MNDTSTTPTMSNTFINRTHRERKTYFINGKPDGGKDQENEPILDL